MISYEWDDLIAVIKCIEEENERLKTELAEINNVLDFLNIPIVLCNSTLTTLGRVNLLIYKLKEEKRK